MKATRPLHNLGQSLWLDNITPDLPTAWPQSPGRRGQVIRQFVERAPGRMLHERCPWKAG